MSSTVLKVGPGHRLGEHPIAAGGFRGYFRRMKTKTHTGADGLGCIPRAAALPNFFRERMVRMNKTNGLVDQIKMGLGIALLAALMGCVGYVGGG